MRQKRHDGVDDFFSKFTADEKPKHVKPLKRWHGKLGIQKLDQHPTVAEMTFHLMQGSANTNWDFKLIDNAKDAARYEVWYGKKGRGIRSANANDLDRFLQNAGWSRDQYAIDTLENITVREVDE